MFFPRRYPGNILSNLALETQENLGVKIGEFEILLDTTARPYLLKNNYFILVKLLFWHNCNGFAYV